MGCDKKPLFNALAVFVGIFIMTGFFGGMAYGADDIGGWKWRAEASTGFAYDSNVFKLSSTQSARFDQNLTKDQTSGRFKNMDSVDDFIFTPRIRASFSRSGIMGGEFSVRPSIAYNVYAQSQEKNFFNFGLDLKQNLGKQGNIGLKLAYAPNIFKKNYLSGAKDAETIGFPGHGISGSEKVFSPAHYDKTSAILSYGRRLWKNPTNTGSGHILAGYENRSFDDPFTVRTEDSLLAGFDVGMTIHKNTSIVLNYLFKNIDTTVGTEVLIRNETNFGGVDFDGDGFIEPINTVTEQTVDRSRNQNTVGGKVSTRLRKGWRGYAKYEARFTHYKSEEQFDVTRLNRTDTRQRVGVGVKGQLAKRWSLTLGWLLTHNAAARDGLALVDKAEAKSYDKNVVSAIISYRL